MFVSRFKSPSRYSYQTGDLPSGYCACSARPRSLRSDPIPALNRRFKGPNRQRHLGVPTAKARHQRDGLFLCLMINELSRPEYGLHLSPPINGEPNGTRCETDTAITTKPAKRRALFCNWQANLDGHLLVRRTVVAQPDKTQRHDQHHQGHDGTQSHLTGHRETGR